MIVTCLYKEWKIFFTRSDSVRSSAYSDGAARLPHLSIIRTQLLPHPTMHHRRKQWRSHGGECLATPISPGREKEGRNEFHDRFRGRYGGRYFSFESAKLWTRFAVEVKETVRPLRWLHRLIPTWGCAPWLRWETDTLTLWPVFVRILAATGRSSAAYKPNDRAAIDAVGVVWSFSIFQVVEMTPLITFLSTFI